MDEWILREAKLYLQATDDVATLRNAAVIIALDLSGSNGSTVRCLSSAYQLHLTFQ